MTKKTQTTQSTQDDRLAEFADEILMGKTTQTASDADFELIQLEETIVRLNKAFPPAPLNEARKKKMQAEFKKRAATGMEKKPFQSFWAKWFGVPQSTPMGMTFAVAALVVMLFILTPALLTTPGSSAAGTALTPLKGFGAAGILAALIIIILWTMRRK